MSRIIAVLNQKGGVGKTTTTVNLGAALARAGKTVLIIDLDPQANATSGLVVNREAERPTSYNILVDHTAAQQAIEHTRVDKLFIVPSTSSLAAAEQELVEVPARESVLAKAIENLSFDFVLIDCPPSLGLLSINALVAAHEVLIPVQTEYYALEGLGLLMQTIQRVQAGLNQSLKLVGVLMTMVDSRNALSGQVIDEVKKYFGELVFKTTVPRNVRLAEAPSFGKTIFEHDKWSKGARAYKSLTKEVIGR